MDARDLSAPITSQTGHSANVKLFLHINNQTIRLVQASEKSIKPAGRQAVPAGNGDLEIQIDSVSYFRNVTVLPGNPSGEWVGIV